jgi:hypothetical protein
MYLMWSIALCNSFHSLSHVSTFPKFPLAWRMQLCRCMFKVLSHQMSS